MMRIPIGAKTFRLAVLAATLLVSACNTVEGVGRDVSAAGRAVAGAASDAKR
jgi:entericidin B